jgi:hypothetical protein
MAEFHITHPVGVYRAFDRSVRKRLENFVSRVDTLASLRFFETNETLHVMGANDGVRTVGSDTFDQEGLMAVLPLFRMLYTGSEPTSFSATINLLKAAVKRDGPLSGPVMQELKALNTAFQRSKSRADIGMIVEWVGSDGQPSGSERMDPEHMIDLWLHGYFFHAENAKADELERWPVEHLPLWELCGAVRRLTTIFRVGREVVSTALEQDVAAIAAA